MEEEPAEPGQARRPPPLLPQHGVVARHASGCLSPPRKVKRFLCMDDTPRSVLEEEGDEELPFYLSSRQALEEGVRQVRRRGQQLGAPRGCCAPRSASGCWPITLFCIPLDSVQGELPCPALWVDESALGSGAGALCVLFRLGGQPQHATLPGKPLRLQPTKQGGGGGGSAQAGAPACRAFVSSRRHTQLYRLVVGMFPKLQSIHAELQSGAVTLRTPFQQRGEPHGVTATPLPQVGALL